MMAEKNPAFSKDLSSVALDQVLFHISRGLPAYFAAFSLCYFLSGLGFYHEGRKESTADGEIAAAAQGVLNK